MQLKPEIVTEEHLVYLDELRESGETNMFGAAPYVANEFSLPSWAARTILAYWMETFSQRHPQP